MWQRCISLSKLSFFLETWRAPAKKLAFMAFMVSLFTIFPMFWFDQENVQYTIIDIDWLFNWIIGMLNKLGCTISQLTAVLAMISCCRFSNFLIHLFNSNCKNSVLLEHWLKMCQNVFCSVRKLSRLWVIFSIDSFTASVLSPSWSTLWNASSSATPAHSPLH